MSKTRPKRQKRRAKHETGQPGAASYLREQRPVVIYGAGVGPHDAAMNLQAAAIHSKFSHPDVTATGEARATVPLERLETLWFNTGTLCNLTCQNCYIESSPTNDRLAYLTRAEAHAFLDEIETLKLGTTEIGLTGGEPFMNPDTINIIEDALSRGFRVLVLTNAMVPMTHRRAALLRLKETYGDRLDLRVSVDHYSREAHERERGPGSWTPTLEGLKWLSDQGFAVHVAGRTYTGEAETALREGYARLFEDEGIGIDPYDPTALVLFPEMDGQPDIPEVTTACWDILGKRPQDQMCATSRMIVKRKDARQPTVVSCTLLPYDEAFEMGATLQEALYPVKLNHPHCAQFCVLGGGSCSGQAIQST